MPELKHNFTQGKMNKDVDERLVPDGQYRDANNVQVSTSDSSDVGALQTLLGNTIKNTIYNGIYSVPTTSTCVGSIAVPNRDKIYYFVSAGLIDDTNVPLDIRRDYIIEYDPVNEWSKYVFVDIYNVREQISTTTTSGDGYIVIPMLTQAGMTTTDANLTGVREGMTVTGTINGTMYTEADNIVVYDIYRHSDTEHRVYLRQNGNAFSPGGTANDYVNFTAQRVLNFNAQTIISAINVVDNTIYWTDNHHEPKKVNIPRSLAGTGGQAHLDNGNPTISLYDNNQQPTNFIFDGDNHFFHTRLVKDKEYYAEEGDRYQVVTTANLKKAVWVREENVTVIKKAPTQPLKLNMSRDPAPRVNDDGVINDAFTTLNLGLAANSGQTFINTDADPAVPYQIGDTFTIHFDEPGVDYRVNDIIILATQDSESNTQTFNDFQAKLKIISAPNNIPNPNVLYTGPFEVQVLYMDSNITANDLRWYARIEDIDPLFEFKFVRFSYRYKYQDGEYSSFAPWSQVAFLPDEYEYFPKKGYNLGMVNQLRALKLEYYHHQEETIPQDVVEIDLLYKETNNAVVYNVKTIKRTDDDPLWPDLVNGQGTKRGEYEVTTDLIHSVLPANQLLRPWDNVPRKALAQEISANRLIYGNYLQNYTVLRDPILDLGIDAKTLGDSNSSFALPSVKSVRSYQVGVVFSDGYGRETPVLTSKHARLRVDKNFCPTRNRIRARIMPKHEIPSWAKYYSFYIKEPSVEYYTLAMDRWYKAEDENIWLSFPSSERNKLQEEDFLILKKGHGNDIAVTEKARYRILAIENEAPEFVRTLKRSMGVLWNTTFDGVPNNIIGNDTRGYPLQDTNFITIEAGLFYGVFGDPVEWLRTPDKMSIRFYGQNGDVSDLYEVVKISPIGTNTSILPGSGGEQVGGADVIKLQILGKFEEDAAFTSTNDTWETRIDGLAVELIEHKVINKPEFDGRFFVKIHRDSVLEKYVLNNGDIDYVVRAAWGLRYLNNNGYENAGTAGTGNNALIPTHARERHHGADAGGLDFDFIVQDPDPDTNVAYNSGVANGNIFFNDHYTRHPTMRPHHTAYYWGGAPAGELGTAFSDFGTGAYNAFGIKNSQINKSPNLALNDDTTTVAVWGDGSTAGQFWQTLAGHHDFFIDGATAYSWTSAEQNRPGSQFAEDRTWRDFMEGNALTTWLEEQESNEDSNIWQNMLTGLVGLIQSIANWVADFLPFETRKADAFAVHAGWGQGGDVLGNSNWGSPSFNGVDHVPGSMKDEKGQPSRAIWGNGKYIDISWTGIGVGYTGDWDEDTNEFGFPHMIEDVNGDVYGAASQFITAMATPGTAWRFRKDPNETAYITEDFALNNNWGYGNQTIWQPGTNFRTGAFGIRNFRTGPTVSPSNSFGGGDERHKRQFMGQNMRQRWTIAVTDAQLISGSAPDFYDPIRGTVEGADTQVAPLHHDCTDQDVIELLEPALDDSGRAHFSNNPAVWETEPRETAELDIYYQASPLIPVRLDHTTNEELIPIGSTFTLPGQPATQVTAAVEGSTHTVTGWNDKTVQFTPAIGQGYVLSDNMSITFTKNLHYSFTATVDMGTQPSVSSAGNLTSLDMNHAGSVPVGLQGQNYLPAYQSHILDWSNCWCFGNGVESDRIRDDFNAPQMDNGVKASSVLEIQSREERRKHGLIWSGIYNSNSGVNNTNQFIQAEKITKDLNPVYGSIQRLYNRNTQLIMFCEDKILQAVTNRDLLYKADGSADVVASNTVVGEATPYQGDYGISKNPESFAATPNTLYFSDAMRGKILALHSNGVHDISRKGMKDHFADLCAEHVWRIMGSYDERKNEYNVSVQKKYHPTQTSFTNTATVSFSEAADGWVSFKSFAPEDGVSINNKYYTFNNGDIWQHHSNDVHNNFYGTQYTSDLTLLVNDSPESVKSFGLINYEGSQGKISAFTDVDGVSMLNGVYSTNDGITSTDNVYDGEYFNLTASNGWYIDNITTDQQTTGNIEFKEKEGKWFAYPSGEQTSLTNLDEKEFTVQGLGTASMAHSNPSLGEQITITIANNTSTSYSGNGGWGNTGAWDETADE